MDWDVSGVGGIARGLGDISTALSNYFVSKKNQKMKKKELKETRRKTFADLLNEALSRGHDTENQRGRSQNELAMARAQALQNMAANYRMR